MNDLLKFMHDTMGDTARIKGSIELLRIGKLTEKEQRTLLAIIESSNKNLMTTLDSYYLANKSE